MSFLELQRDVQRANVTVKTQFLTLGPRLAPQLASMTDPREIATLLTNEVTSICNDLAYEEELHRQPGTCPACGRKVEGIEG